MYVFFKEDFNSLQLHEAEGSNCTAAAVADCQRLNLKPHHRSKSSCIIQVTVLLSLLKNSFVVAPFVLMKLFKIPLHTTVPKGSYLGISHLFIMQFPMLMALLVTFGGRVI